MFSYLRPTGRRVPSSQASQGPSNETSVESLQDQIVSPYSEADDDPIYRPIVSPTAPVLPPIPRVASVYGAPANLPSFDRRNENASSEKSADNRKEKKQEAASSTLGRLPSSENADSATEGVNVRSSTRNNFSRPFKPISGPSQTAVSQVSRPVRSAESSSHEHSVSEINLSKNHERSRSELQTLHRPRTSEDKLPQFGMRPASRARSDIIKEQSDESHKEQTEDLPQTVTSKRRTAAPNNTGFHGAQPILQRATQSSLQIAKATTQPLSEASDLPVPGRSILPSHKSLQNVQSEIGSQSQMPSQQQKAPQLISLSNNSNAPQRSSKLMLTRLNPMSLWARRRSSQPASEIDNDPHRRNVLIGNKKPENYDPRIRGNRVHDFSAPRPRQPLSPLEITTSASGQKSRSIPSPKSHAEASSQGVGIDNASKQRRESERQHTPVFKEHFGDEIDTWRFDKNDRRNQNTTGILERMPIQASEEHLSPLPPFAQKFPETVHDPLLLSDPTFAVAPRSSLDQSQNSSGRSSATALVPPKDSSPRTSISKSSSRSRSRTPSIQDSSSISADLPKHLQSNASRFSFDLAGVGSAVQEKLLEDKHRQKIAQRARMSRASELSAAATDEDFDEDDIDFEAGIEEEEIPGVNVDYDDYPVHGSIANTTLAQGPVQLYTHANINLNSNFSTAQNAEADNGLVELQGSLPGNTPRDKESDDDDLYFDDGMIEDVVHQECEKFDESVFDDETSGVFSRPLRDLQPEIKPEPELEREPLSAVPEAESDEESSQQSTRPISLESSLATGQNHGATTDTSRTSVQPPDKSIAGRRGSALKQDLTLQSLDQPAGLTKDNLAAYHDALALATHKAAQEGRFDRKASVDEPRQSNTIEGGTAHVTFGEDLPVRNVQPFGMEIDGGNGLDDYEHDDDIIAAANAEALENDDEGFYGREFGFYARSNGSTEAQFANGGYFGPAGLNDIKRSHSGRVNGQEPSLTPITERSEWSQRNSMISLAMHSGHGSFPASLQTPGLAQIADSIQYEDDSNMSLSALMKLRQNAWGGSSTSLQSNGGSVKSSSPPKTGSGISPPPRPGIQAIQPHAQQENKHRPNPLRLDSSDLMMSPIFPPPRSGGSEPPLSPLRRSAVKGHSSPAKGHSRNSSGADSVTYIKEKDEEGARWVMERRRTGEGGQIEVLGRQVVEGGRI